MEGKENSQGNSKILSLRRWKGGVVIYFDREKWFGRRAKGLIQRGWEQEIVSFILDVLILKYLRHLCRAIRYIVGYEFGARMSAVGKRCGISGQNHETR